MNEALMPSALSDNFWKGSPEKGGNGELLFPSFPLFCADTVVLTAKNTAASDVSMA